MSIIGLVCWLMALALSLWVFLVWRGFTQDWLPDDLKAGRVVMVEKTLWVASPFAVVGRPDQVYRLLDGFHVPVENKNRDVHRVYETDIAQLSLQAWLLRRQGRPTAPYGYVAINSRQTGKRQAIRVDLGDDAYCERLITRYLDIIEGRAQARNSRGAKCRTCGHLSTCHGTAQ